MYIIVYNFYPKTLETDNITCKDKVERQEKKKVVYETLRQNSCMCKSQQYVRTTYMK